MGNAGNGPKLLKQCLGGGVAEVEPRLGKDFVAFLDLNFDLPEPVLVVGRHGTDAIARMDGLPFRHERIEQMDVLDDELSAVADPHALDFASDGSGQGGLHQHHDPVGKGLEGIAALVEVKFVLRGDFLEASTAFHDP